MKYLLQPFQKNFRALKTEPVVKIVALKRRQHRLHHIPHLDTSCPVMRLRWIANYPVHLTRFAVAACKFGTEHANGIQLPIVNKILEQIRPSNTVYRKKQVK